MVLGPETFSILFAKGFTDCPLVYKQFLADSLTPIYKDALSQLNCSTDICDGLDAKKAVLQAALDEMDPFLGTGGGGGS